MARVLLNMLAQAATAIVLARRARRRRIFAAYMHLVRRQGFGRRLVPRHVTDLDEGRFQENFRFDRDQFAQVVEAYDLGDEVDVGFRIRVPVWDAIGIVLRRLAFPGAWTQHVDFFGRNKSVLSLVFSHTVQLMFGRCRDRIQRPSRTFLTNERLLAYCAAIRNKGSPFRHLFGFIDGTCYQICRPGGETKWQRSVYNGHHRYHCLKWQGVNTPDGMICFLHGPYPGTAHDITILQDTGLLDTLMQSFALPPGHANEAETHFFLYGDAGTSFGCRSLSAVVPAPCFTCRLCQHEIQRPASPVHEQQGVAARAGSRACIQRRNVTLSDLR